LTLGEKTVPENEIDQATRSYASFLSKARFGPGIIGILASIAAVTVGLYLTGHPYLAVVSGGADVLILGVKGMEIIQLSRPEKQELVGRKCLVVKRIERGKMGVVRIYNRGQILDAEFWSAESDQEIPEGRTAIVTGLRSIVLLVKPLHESSSSQ
jgi:membrane protein implicated in regulation of membrane protease activity